MTGNGPRPTPKRPAPHAKDRAVSREGSTSVYPHACAAASVATRSAICWAKTCPFLSSPIRSRRSEVATGCRKTWCERLVGRTGLRHRADREKRLDAGRKDWGRLRQLREVLERQLGDPR